MSTRFILTAVSLSLAAGAASAGTFSFAADANEDGPNLQGAPTTANTFTIADGSTKNFDGSVQVDFKWDPDEDGPAGAVTIPAYLTLNAESKSYSKLGFGGTWIHTYSVAGTYNFRQISDGTLIFTAAFSNAVWTSVSADEFRWGQTASLQSSDTTDSGISFTAGPALGAIDLSFSEDFTFSLSALSAVGGGTVGLAADGTPTSSWVSEASWSAQAVPAPGAVVLAGLGGLLCARRRR
ncbi:MAG: hypothetical protein GIKADHBN_01758 [Phycisphaerales bacterium]|nr:hypothetical protein [Phycisphaerales bacterium]